MKYGKHTFYDVERAVASAFHIKRERLLRKPTDINTRRAFSLLVIFLREACRATIQEIDAHYSDIQRVNAVRLYDIYRQLGWDTSFYEKYEEIKTILQHNT